MIDEKCIISDQKILLQTRSLHVSVIMISISIRLKYITYENIHIMISILFIQIIEIIFHSKLRDTILLSVIAKIMSINKNIRLIVLRHNFCQYLHMTSKDNK